MIERRGRAPGVWRQVGGITSSRIWGWPPARQREEVRGKRLEEAILGRKRKTWYLEGRMWAK